MQENLPPEYLYKILTREQWRLSQKEKKVILEAMDKNFIHFATKSQISSVVKKFFNNQNYVVLKLNTKKLKGELVYESNPGGATKYYHLYEGSIPYDAIVEDFMKTHILNYHTINRDN